MGSKSSPECTAVAVLKAAAVMGLLCGAMTVAMAMAVALAVAVAVASHFVDAPAVNQRPIKVRSASVIWVALFIGMIFSTTTCW